MGDIDLTPYVETLKMTYKVICDEAEKEFLYGFATQQPVGMLSLTLDITDGTNIEKLFPRTQTATFYAQSRGKYWFDFASDVEIKMNDFKVTETGEVTATYAGAVIKDRTSKGYLARFLRWILRR